MRMTEARLKKRVFVVKGYFKEIGTKTFVSIMEALGYDVELHYVKREG